ncbi:uncharacterized protein TRIVIDRAFT_222458 [Trichoderma virens Gv29-8]|uniref:Uncharacterized protein n=1 Tax=Hypocrea virens (strain Gv29-8 / FGSC 10586) TaxID=413071 RepID=G9MTX6_HYPVG|nr:uncharacterized protein TRIVIDRAFT_222458 [Trichoderma virens Gv29-8]EHK22105.1 hypothetical protein TRIVIDRAFT_222458 [Trichoderma virens Gv29-8]UKZ57151.1 hypothetical protein TrVGV298_011003 [Trichoderma virens]UKZ82885.1 hypothetical protein TrVFT333_010685 [Trichoderma virens FT-333]
MPPHPLTLITGSTQGIGRAVAEILARKHAHHVLLGVRNVQVGEAIASELRQDGHKASVVELDLTSAQSIEKAITTIDRHYGYLDVLVNNAGISSDHDESLNKWDIYTSTFTTNVIGTGVLTEGLVPLLRKAKCSPPRVVFVSSIMGSLQTSLDKTTAWYSIDYKVYDASKAAVNMLAINFSRVLDDVGGKVNAVCPGYINTRLTSFDERGESPEVGATRIVQLATAGEDGQTGTFTNRQGVLPW